MKTNFTKQKLIALVSFFILLTWGQISWGQTTLGIQDFEVAPATPTWTYSATNIGTPGTTGPTTYTTVTGTDVPAVFPLFVSGARGYRVSGNTGTVGKMLTFAAINTTGYTSIYATFRIAAFSIGSTTNGMDNNAGVDQVLVEVSPDGGTTWYQQSILITSLSNARWAFNQTAVGTRAYQANNTYTTHTVSNTTSPNAITTITVTGLPAVTNLQFRISATCSATVETWAIDDVKIVGTLATTPVISTTGTLSAVNTTYGTASATPTSFAVSGTDMTAGILVTPPSGYEVSLASGSGYASSITVGAAGTIASTTVYVRLAATTAVGSYSGNIVCSSSGATSVNVATVSSTVTAKALTVTSDNIYKVVGTTLTSGTGKTTFTSSGLANSETIGSVTLTYGTGAAAGDAIGTYPGTSVPTLATGGTFTASNYSITYVNGDIIVTAAPVISTTGTLIAVNTTYGTASASPTSFTVSGTDMSAGILVTPPAGYEVCLTIGGTYTSTVTVGAAGTIASTDVYVRLTSTASVASSPYSGNIVCSSSGATSVNVATVSSSVSAKALTVTADNVSKVFGATLTSGSGKTAFTSSGLANSETIGSVTITYGTGGAAVDPVAVNIGTAVPTLATGGTFTASNYTITYVAGNITVTAAPSGPIVAWQFGSPASLGSEATYNATTNDANLNTSVLSRGTGITATGLARGFSANAWDVGATKANAVTNNEYFQFTINSKSGYIVSLSTLDARLRRTGTAPNAYIWKYSIDGTNFTEIGTDISFTSTVDGVDQTQIDLSGITALQNVPSTTTLTFRIYAWGGTSLTATFAIARYADGVTTNCLAIGGTVTSSGPSIIVSPTALTGFIYSGAGPSTSQSYTLSGSLLTGYPGNIAVACATNYEVSTDNSSFSGSVNIPYTTATLAATTIYVRLKAGLSVGSYNSENVTNAGGGATTVNVACSGDVTAVPAVALSDNGTQVVAANVNQGTSTVVLHKFKLDVTNANATLSGMTCTTSGSYITSDITNLKFWYSADNAIGSDVLLSTLTSPGTAGLLTFASFTSQTINAATIGYFFITADISASATVGNTISVNAITTGDLTISGANKTGSTAIGGTQTILGVPIQLATYPFTGTYCTAAAYSPSGVVANLTFSNISVNSINCNNGEGNTAFSGDVYWGSSFSAANYIQFTVTPASGYQLTAYSLVFDKWRTTNGATNYAVRSNIDNYAANIASGTVSTTQTTISAIILGSTFQNLSSAVTFRIYGYGGGSSGYLKFDNIKLNGSVYSVGATINVSQTSLTNFTYPFGLGPSSSQTYNISGTNLSPASGNITVTGSTNYEVSTDNSSFSGSVNIPYTTATLAATTIYVRLKSGLAIGNYNSEIITISGGNANSKTVTCSGNVTAGAISTLSSSATLTEPATISSLWDTPAELFASFDFTFADDNGSGGDALNTQISQIVFYQATGNDVADYTKVIAYAKLVDNNSKELVGTVNATDITFSNIPNTSAGNDLGYIADNASKTYTIYLYLKTDLGTEKTTIDGKNLVFEVNNTSFVFEAVSSSLAAAQTVNSGATNNEITVVATQLLYTTNKPPASTTVSTNTNVEVEATDINGNRDLGSTASVTVAKTTGTGNVTSASGLTKSLASGIYSWTDVQFDAAGTYTITASGGALTSITSGNIIVTTTPSVIWSDNCDPEHTWDLDNGSANWVNITPTTNPTAYNGDCFKTVAGNTNYANSKEYILTSEVIDLSGYTSCSMSFWLWMMAEANYDGGIIEFSTNGTTWTKYTGDLAYDGDVSALGTTGWSTTRTTWTKVSINIGALDGQSTVQFRFRFKTDASITNYGWAVDEMQITGTPSCTGPSVQATDLTFNNVSGTSMNLVFTRGNGDGGVIIVARQGSAVNADPVSGIAYTANATFGTPGTELGTGNYVLYNGIANDINTATSNITISGLTSATTYYFAIYEYNATGVCYNKTELTGNRTTICTTPTNAAASATPASSIVTLNWTAPTCYEEVLIVAKPTSTISGTPSGDGSTYNADLNFVGTGTTFDGTGKVVYKGTTSPQTVYGLTNGTLYYFKIYTRTGLSWSTGVEVSATPNACTATNGSGTATAVNGASGNINGETIWQRNKTGQVIDIVVTGVSSGCLQNVQIDLSTVFGNLLETNVTLSGGAVYGGTTKTRTGDVLLINNLNLTNINTLTVHIIGLTSDDITLDTDLGNRTITVQTGNTAGSRSNITSSPTVNLTIPFANAKKFTDNGSTGALVNKGSTVALEGVSTIASGRLSSSSYDQFFIQEGEGAGAKGICVRKGSAFSPVVLIAHNYIVKGPLDLISGSVTGQTDCYKNMTAINTPTKIIDLGEAQLPTPYLVTIEELYAMSYVDFEEIDGLLMRVPSVEKASGTWPALGVSSGDVRMKDFGQTNNLRCYIFGNTDVGGTEPTWPKSMATLVYNYNQVDNYMGKQITPVYKMNFFDKIVWNGSTGNGKWSDALNWSPNILPQSTDDVLFDNITADANSYTVTFDVTTAQSINSLRINPSTGKIITLNFPNTCTLSPALTINTVNDAIVIENGGVLNANFGSASGNPLTFATATTGKLKINNGGKFVWMCDESNQYITDRLSSDAGTETGIFEFDIQSSANEAISLAGRTFGTLVLSASDGANDYKIQGSNDIIIRGDFTINTNVAIDETWGTDYSGTINIAGNFINNASSWLVNTTVNVPDNLFKFNGTTIQTISGSSSVYSLSGAGFDKNFEIDNSVGVVLNTSMNLNNAITINASKKFIINPTIDLTVNTITNNGGSAGLVLKSDATGTASLIHNSSSVAATCERYFLANQWSFLFSPLDNAEKTDLTTTSWGAINPNFYTYTESRDDYWNATTNYSVTLNNIGWIVPSEANMSTNYGYIHRSTENKIYEINGGNLYYNLAGKTFSGLTYNVTPDNDGTSDGKINVPVLGLMNWTTFDGWNFVGNPHTSAFDWDAVTLTNVEDGIYFYDGASNQYKFYGAASNDNGISALAINNLSSTPNIIPANQGFFVKVASAGTGSVAIPNSARVHSNQDFYKNSNKVSSDLLRFRIEKDDYFDESIVRSLEIASDYRDENIDAYKMFSWNNNVPQIFTKNYNDDLFIVNSINLISSNKQVPIGIYIGVDGEYSINFTQNTYQNINVYLEDKLDSLLTNVRLNSIYSFYSQTGSFTDRFVLHFNINNAPLANELANIEIYENSDLTLDMNNVFYEIDTLDAVTVEFTQLPNWVNNDNFILSGIPTNDEVGIHTVKIKATDLAGGITETEFIITVLNVNDAPYIVQQIENQYSNEDEVYEFTVSEILFNDIDLDDVLSLNFENLPNWLSFENNILTGTPNNDEVGEYNLTLRATDIAGAFTQNQFTLTVVNTNDAPTLNTNIPDATVEINNLWNYILPQNIFADIDADDILVNRATLIDGTSLPSWLTFENNIFNGQSSEPQILQIRVFATDIFGAEVYDDFTLTVFKNIGLDENLEQIISVYPNPTQDFVTIEIPIIEENINIRVVSTSGSVIYNKHIFGAKTQIDLTQYPTGVYVIEIQFSQTIVRKKLVKN